MRYGPGQNPGARPAPAPRGIAGRTNYRPPPLSQAQRQAQVQFHVDHYNENPALHARALNALGVPRNAIAELHRESLGGAANRPAQMGLASGGMLSGVVKYGGRAVSDLASAAENAPVGIYGIGKALGSDVLDPSSYLSGKPELFPASRKLGGQIVKQTAKDFTVRGFEQHPGNALLDAWAVASLGAGTASRLGAAGEAVRAGDIAGALTRPGYKGGSLLSRPEPAPIMHQVGDLKVPQPASRNPLYAAMQRGAAKIRAGGPPGSIRAGLNARRVGKELDINTRIETDLQKGGANQLQAMNRQIGRRSLLKPKPGEAVAQRAALTYAQEGIRPADAIRLHEEQIAKGVGDPVDHQRQIKIAGRAQKYLQDVQDPERGLVPQIKPEYRRLVNADRLFAKVSGQGTRIAVDTGQMTPAGAEARIHAPARVVAGARYERTPAATGRVEQVRTYPGKTTTTTQPMTADAAQARLAELDKQYEAMIDKVAPAVAPHDNPAAVQLRRNFVNSRLGKGKFLGTKRQPTITQEARARADSKIRDAIANAPNSPVAQKAAAILAERERLQNELNVHAESAFGGTQTDAPIPLADRIERAVAATHATAAPEVATAVESIIRRLAKSGGGGFPSNVIEGLQYRGGVFNRASVEDAERAARNAFYPEARRSGGTQTANFGTTTRTVTGKPRSVHLRAIEPQRAEARLVGAENVKAGRSYVPAYTSEPRMRTGPAGHGSSGVVGRVRNVISKNKPYAGEGRLQGRVPSDPLAAAARHTSRLVDQLSSDRFRQQVLAAAHDTRLGTTDLRGNPTEVLVNERTMKNPPVPREAKIALGREHSTLDEVSGHVTAMQALRERLFPMEHPGDLARLPSEHQDTAMMGKKVPGYKWVDQRILRGANKPPPRLPGGRGVDMVNRAVRIPLLEMNPKYGATIGTSNAGMSLLQHHFNPAALTDSMLRWHGMHSDDKYLALAGMGEGWLESATAGSKLERLNALERAIIRGEGKVINAPSRMASFSREASKKGFRTADERHALLTDPKLESVRTEVFRRARDAVIDFGRLSAKEREITARAIFFFPWLKGATRYAGHVVTEHPAFTGSVAQAGRIGQAQQLAKYGQPNVQGRKTLPQALAGALLTGSAQHPQAWRLGAINVPQTAVDTAKTLLEPLTGKGFQPTSLLTPGFGIPVSLASGQNPSTGQAFPKSMSFLSKLKQIGESYMPFVQAAQRAGGVGRALHGAEALVGAHAPLPATSKQAQHLFQYTPQTAAAKELFGGLAPVTVNPSVAGKDVLREQMQSMGHADRVLAEYKVRYREIRAAVAATPGVTVTPELHGRMSLHYERSAARAKLGTKLTPMQRLQADLSVIVRHRWMKPAEMKNALQNAKTATASDYTDVFRYLTEHYFDQGHELSGAVKWLRDHGHPNLKVPALP